MLELLQQANLAARTEGRRQLLEGLLCNDDRLVRRAMEEGEDHGEMLDDEFFIPFMGLAAAVGSKNVWRTLKEWGYSFDTIVAKDGELTLAQWAACFVDLDRLDDLQAKGLMDTCQNMDNKRGHRLTPAEVALLSGDREHFDYWLPQWIDAQKAKRTLQASPHRSPGSTQYWVPRVLATLIGQNIWARTKDRPLPSGYPDHWPQGEELTTRTDIILESLLEAVWPTAPGESRLAKMTQAPPRHEKELVVPFLAGWQVKREAAPFAEDVEVQALKKEDHTWLLGLLHNGAPLDRLGDGSFGRGLLSQTPDEQKTVEWKCMDVYIKRAKTEKPDLLETLWRATPNKKNGSEQWPEHMALKAKHYVKFAKMMQMGCPADRGNANNHLPGDVLIQHMLKSENGDAELAWNSWTLRLGEIKPAWIPLELFEISGRKLQKKIEDDRAGVIALMEKMRLDFNSPQVARTHSPKNRL